MSTSDGGPLLSIVVPVFNTALYLDSFLESFSRQSRHSDCELILIDDGSTDGSSLICDRFAEGRSNVHVFHQSNRGVSAARNLGLARASGEFVWFCDSDDRISSGAFVAILDALGNWSPDILVFSILLVDTSGNQVGEIPAPRRPIDGFDGPLQCGNSLYPHAHVFRRSLAEGLEFDTSLALLEDRDFFYRLCLRGSRSTEVLEASLYSYLVSRPGSAVNTPSIRKSLGACRVDHDILLNELERGFPNPAYDLYAARAVRALTSLSRLGQHRSEFDALRAELLDLDRFSLCLSGKLKAQYVALKNAPILYRCLCRMADPLWRCARISKGGSVRLTV